MTHAGGAVRRASRAAACPAPEDRLRQLLTALALLGAGMLASEAVLRVAAFVSPQVRITLGRPARAEPPWIANDPAFGEAPNPAFPEHDAWGFRNATRPASARVVALGDSQTYGAGVRAEEAWPKQLEDRLERPVYSLAVSGWGPTEWLLVVDRALLLEPEVVVGAFYFGNDLYDAYEAVYLRDQHPELAHPDPGVRAEIARLQRQSPLLEEVAEHAGLVRDGLVPRLRGLLRAQSAVYQLLRAGRIAWENRSATSTWETARRVAATHPDSREIFEIGPLRTIFTSRYRLVGLDQEDVRIREGLRISLEAIARVAGAVEATQRRFVALLVPTKETAYAKLPEAADLAPRYARLLAQERRARAETTRFLRERGVEVLDATPRLQERLAAGEPLYREMSDGHPAPSGHGVLADLVRERLVAPRRPAGRPGRSTAISNGSQAGPRAAPRPHVTDSTSSKPASRQRRKRSGSRTAARSVARPTSTAPS